MIGLIFLVSLIVFTAAALCQWSLSSRNKGKGWLLNWFPPYALYFAFIHRKQSKASSIFVFASFFLLVLSSGAWIATKISQPTVSTISTTPSWQARILDNVLIIQEKSGTMIAQKEWQIRDKRLAETLGEESVTLTRPDVIYSYLEHSSKQFQTTVIETDSVELSPKDGGLLVAIDTGRGITELHASVEQPKRATLVLTEQKIRDNLQPLWKSAPRQLSYSIGVSRDISDKQSIVAIRISDKTKLIKELTLTFNKRPNDIVINHRSMLVLRKFLSDYQVNQPTRKKFNTLTLNEFISIEERYRTKSVQIIKRDGSDLQGFYGSVEKQKVLNITQPLGAGVVEVKTPLELIESFSFQDLKVDLTEPEVTDENVIYEIVEEEVATTQDVLEGQTVPEDNVQTAEVADDVQTVSDDSVVAESESAAEPDPYLDLIGKDLAIIKKDGQRRIGRLVKVVPFKSLTLQLLNGGIEVQIPQEEVERVEFK